MASITKSGKRWRAQVKRNGVRRSETFDTKAAAQAWATREEAAIIDAKHGVFPRKTLAEAFERYSREVSPRKKMWREEWLRLQAFQRDFPAIARKRLDELSTPDFAAWRDKRLETVSGASVERDLTIVSHLFSVARDEWKWIAESPLKGLRWPGQNPARTRLPTWREVRAIVRWLGYSTKAPIDTKYRQGAMAYLIACRTAMRLGEVLQLRPDVGAVAEVSHKTQHLTGQKRRIPLSRSARRLIARIPAGGWTISAPSLDAVFRKARDSAGIADLHFHDSRALALTLLARKVDVMTLAKISGHRDVRILANTYYRERPEAIAERL